MRQGEYQCQIVLLSPVDHSITRNQHVITGLLDIDTELVSSPVRATLDALNLTPIGLLAALPEINHSAAELALGFEGSNTPVAFMTCNL